jgi:hypothetical protein
MPTDFTLQIQNAGGFADGLSLDSIYNLQVDDESSIINNPEYLYKGCFKVSGITGQKLDIFASRSMTADMGYLQAVQASNAVKIYKYFGLFPATPTWMAKPPMMPATASKKVAERKQLALLS